MSLGAAGVDFARFSSGDGRLWGSVERGEGGSEIEGDGAGEWGGEEAGVGEDCRGRGWSWAIGTGRGVEGERGGRGLRTPELKWEPREEGGLGDPTAD